MSDFGTVHNAARTLRGGSSLVNELARVGRRLARWETVGSPEHVHRFIIALTNAIDDSYLLRPREVRDGTRPPSTGELLAGFEAALRAALLASHAIEDDIRKEDA